MDRLRSLIAIAILAGLGLGGTHGQVPLPPGIIPTNIFEPNDPCKDIKNKSVIDLPRHKYVVVENCLYYSLQRDVDTKAKQPNAIALLPPTSNTLKDFGIGKDERGDTENVTLNLNGITIQSIWVNEMMKDMRIRGYIPVSWKDSRLTWDPREWKIQEMGVQTAAHIWVPQLSTEKHDTTMVMGDSVDYKRIRVTNRGNVSALMIFNLQAYCDVDSHNFPADIHSCCIQLRPTFDENILRFKITNPDLYTIDTRFAKYTGYRIEHVGLEIATNEAKDGDDGDDDGLQFCVRVARSNSTLHVELAIPMAICAVLILFAPLFGSFKTQIQVKLFALLLQYLCLQFLANKMSYLGNERTPRIFRFYEFTIVMNLVSLLLTVFVSAANRIERSLPPAQSLINTSMVINKLCFCLSATDEGNEGVVIGGEDKKYRKDWREVFSAAHSILMSSVVLIYLIGVCVIYT